MLFGLGESYYCFFVLVLDKFLGYLKNVELDVV